MNKGFLFSQYMRKEICIWKTFLYHLLKRKENETHLWPPSGSSSVFSEIIVDPSGFQTYGASGIYIAQVFESSPYMYQQVQFQELVYLVYQQVQFHKSSSRNWYIWYINKSSSRNWYIWYINKSCVSEIRSVSKSLINFIGVHSCVKRN